MIYSDPDIKATSGTRTAIVVPLWWEHDGRYVRTSDDVRHKT